jgi:hypothetical protein
MISDSDIPQLSLTQKIGAAFIGGGIAGFTSGTLIGLSRTLNELPLIRLNAVLNTATLHGSAVAYHCGMATSLFVGTTLVADRLRLRPPVRYATALGAVGLFCGSRWGTKTALKTGVLGAAIGASYGVWLEKSKDIPE